MFLLRAGKQWSYFPKITNFGLKDSVTKRDRYRTRRFVIRPSTFRTGFVVSKPGTSMGTYSAESGTLRGPATSATASA